MDETSGTTVNDNFGTGNATAKNGPVPGRTGKLGSAWQFDGSNDYICTDTDSNGSCDDVLDQTGSFSVSAWIKTTDTDGAIVSKAKTSSDRSFWLHVSGGRARFDVNAYRFIGGVGNCSTSTPMTITSPITATVNDGNWHHIVGLFTFNNMSTGSSSIVEIYIDRVLRGLETSFTSGMCNTTADLEIGAYLSGTYNLSGLIDEVGIWSRPLTSAEITSLYNSGNGLSL